MSNRVAITRVKDCDFDAAVRQALELAGGFMDLIRPDSRVVVKPNLARRAPSGSGAVTDARVTEAVTKAVLDLRPASVTIAEGAPAGYDDASLSTEEVFRLSGTDAVAQRLGVPCVYLNTDEPVSVEVPSPLAMDRILIARTILDADVVISVPVLKTHPRTNATIALKNLWGCVPGTEKRAGHMLGINASLVDLLSVLRPTYSVVDASVAAEGFWRVPEDSRVMGLILAGADAVAVDVVGCSLMGVDPQTVFYLRETMKRDGYITGLQDIEVVGESVADHAEQFKQSFDLFMQGFPDIRIVYGPAFCSGCVAELVSALNHIRDAGYGEWLKGLTLVVGGAEDFEPSEKMAFIGECSADLAGSAPCVGGCPPDEDDVFEAICAACGADVSVVMSVRDEARRRKWDSSMHLIQQ
ncbi:DUF362 domain-containing protein [candidate division WOR-3 bacterium]|nr:DUF362 domain-containing protein [candidate division WOR-3 bacterium]